MRFSYSSLKLSENCFHLALLITKPIGPPPQNEKKSSFNPQDKTKDNRKFSYTKREIVYTQFISKPPLYLGLAPSSCYNDKEYI